VRKKGGGRRRARGRVEGGRRGRRELTPLMTFSSLVAWPKVTFKRSNQSRMALRAIFWRNKGPSPRIFKRASQISLENEYLRRVLITKHIATIWCPGKIIQHVKGFAKNLQGKTKDGKSQKVEGGERASQISPRESLRRVLITKHKE
jgi:hypothetical protein